MCGAATGETAAHLFGYVKLSTREGSGSGDRVIRAAIARSLRVKEREYTFGTISRPSRDGPSFGLGQRLRRTHSGILADSSALTGFEIGREYVTVIDDILGIRGTRIAEPAVRHVLVP
jgi:hypothetical protein